MCALPLNKAVEGWVSRERVNVAPGDGAASIAVFEYGRTNGDEGSNDYQGE